MKVKTVRVLQAISTALCVLALLAVLVVAIAQKPFMKLYYQNTAEMPKVFPTYQFLHTLIMSAFMALIFLLVRKDHTPGQTCAIVAIGVSVLALLQIAVFPLLQVVLTRSTSYQGGEMSLAAYSALQGLLSFVTSPFLSAATILHLLAMGGYWRNGEDGADAKKAQESVPGKTDGEGMINML